MTATGHGHYGIDAPHVLYGLAAAALGATAAPPLVLTAYATFNAAFAAIAVVCAPMTCSHLWSTRRGKFAVWAAPIDGLALHGEERVLDVGCGRDAVLLLAAQRLAQGQAVGIDLWSAKDHSGNNDQATLRNAELEGVRERVTLRTADMRALPFPDCSFEVVTHSLAIHNIVGAAQRERALAEILRGLKPGGTALIADIGHSLT